MLFAPHGLSLIVVSDDRTSSTSSEFKAFMARNNIERIKTPPYHLGSSGLAERTVQMLVIRYMQQILIEVLAGFQSAF